MPALPIRQDICPAELRRLACKEKAARVARRLLAIAMALEGASRDAAARHAGMDRQTLRDWVVRYNAQGLDGLRDRERSGRPPLLAPELEDDLIQLIEAGPEVDRERVVEYRVKHICRLSKQHFGADYTRSGMQARLHRMKMSFLKPRPLHPKTDLEAQEAFKKTSSRGWHRSQRIIRRPRRSRCGSRMKRGSARREP